MRGRISRHIFLHCLVYNRINLIRQAVDYENWEWKTIRNDQEIYYYNASCNFIPEEFAGQLFEMIQGGEGAEEQAGNRIPVHWNRLLHGRQSGASHRI